jgi:pimeloyl-ACP methyl ester carboxylesterase
MPQVRLQGATIEYRELGPTDSAHPPVLFVHGILVDHRLWMTVAESLARNGFRCILPDLPLGSHTVPVDPHVTLTPVTVAEMINDFIGALDLRDVTLVGNDTGGGLCQLLIDAHPDSVGRLADQLRRLRRVPPFPFNVVFAISGARGRSACCRS